MERRSNILFGLLALLFLTAGCSTPPIDIDAEAPVLSPELSAAISNHVAASLDAELSARIEQNKMLSATSGPQSAGDGGWNIGAVNIEGGAFLAAIIAIIVLGLAAAYLYVSRRRLTQSAKEVARSVAVNLPPEARDGLLDDLDRHMTHKRAWNKAIGNFRIKKKKKAD